MVGQGLVLDLSYVKKDVKALLIDVDTSRNLSRAIFYGEDEKGINVFSTEKRSRVILWPTSLNGRKLQFFSHQQDV